MTRSKEQKVYHITGWLYVPLDGEVLATSKKEAREKWTQAVKDYGYRYDFTPNVHECITDTTCTSKDFAQVADTNHKDVIFTANEQAITG